MKIGSLFSGIGGLELGLERGLRSEGIEATTVFQVEQDEYCRAVLAKHWPNAKRYEDVRNVGRETLENVDIICGGFPCQDISYCGSGAGLAGERSGLWSEFARIVCELGPEYVVVENVAALLTRGLGDVLGTLAESGYDAEWSCVQALDVGAPHIRDRLFILAYPNGSRCSRPRLLGEQQGRTETVSTSQTAPDTPSDIRRPPWNDGPEAPDRSNSPLAHANCVDAQGIIGGSNDAEDRRIPRERQAGLRDQAGRDSQWAIEPNVGRVAHGVPSRMDRLKSLGNAVVPQVAEVVGCLIAEREKELRLSA